MFCAKRKHREDILVKITADKGVGVADFLVDIYRQVGKRIYVASCRASVVQNHLHNHTET